MSDVNPFAPPQSATVFDDTSREVSLSPVDLYKRSFALIKEQYWLFLGISIVGILIGSIIPFAILLGPMLVGIYLCFIDLEQGEKVEFGTLFKGFDLFVNALVATLIAIGVSLIVIIPMVILMMVGMFTMLPPGDGNEMSVTLIPFMLLFYALLFIAILLIQLPFLFAFQLIADKKLTGPEAVMTSFRGVRKNFVGCVLLAASVGVASLLATLACYIPVFFLTPLHFGVFYLAYRDVFGPTPMQR